MTREEILSDLAYAKAIAEEGRQAPLIGGRYLVFFGLLLALTYVTHWAISTGVVAAPDYALGLVWACFGVAAGVGSSLVYRRIRGLPGATALGNRIDRAVWFAATMAIFAAVIGCLVGGALRGDPRMADAIMPTVFGIYGLALMTTATVAEKSWLKFFAFGAFCVAAVLWIVLAQPWSYLLGATAALVVLVTPGVIMIRGEPSTIV